MENTKEIKRILIIGDDSYIGCKIKQWLDNYPKEFITDIVSSRDNRWKSERDFSEFDVVVNTAGLAHIAHITKDMEPLFYAINRDLPINIAKWAKEKGVKHFIHLSSMNVYGDFCEEIKRLNSENPSNFYGGSKLQGDLGLKKLEDETFKVSYLRPPFVYGKGCRGNYNKVSNLAKKLPFFPNYPNKKSMIYIDNLCEFIRITINHRLYGVLAPQNKELVSTSDLVRTIAKINGKKMLTTKFFNPFIKIGVKLSKNIQRGFGNDNYNLELSRYNNFDYCVVDFEESIKRTEL